MLKYLLVKKIQILKQLCDCMLLQNLSEEFTLFFSVSKTALPLRYRETQLMILDWYLVLMPARVWHTQSESQVKQIILLQQQVNVFFVIVGWAKGMCIFV